MSDTLALVVLFSRTGNNDEEIMNTYIKIFQPKSHLEHYRYSIITAYAKYKGISDYLV